ncbi:hypothetical protein SUGI_0573210 [Cryptomeria japonica]|nr:hypothetical protein SUGI_0573210 [Cryptomeria japonica]
MKALDLLRLDGKARAKAGGTSIHPTAMSRDMAFYNDNRAIAAFGAIEKGVFVSAAAGNNGPSSSSLGNVAPWITTLGARSIDRDFPASFLLGNQEMYKGTSTYSRVDDATLQRPFSLVYVSTDIGTSYCLSGSLDPKLVKAKLWSMIKYIPTKKWREQGVQELLGKTIGVMDHNSRIDSCGKGNNCSRVFFKGPSEAYPHVLKADIIAPGLSILAAYTQELPYNILSGTSMSCPHVSGIATLVKKRTVTYVGREGDAVYRVSVNNPAGITISVEPQTLKFGKPLEAASYSVKFEATVASIGDTVPFGEIMRKCTQGGSQIVRSLVAINMEA